jgi:hypothetical protein
MLTLNRLTSHQNKIALSHQIRGQQRESGSVFPCGDEALDWGGVCH